MATHRNDQGREEERQEKPLPDLLDEFRTALREEIDAA